MPSIRFRTMYRDLGLNRASVAQLLRVSERTIQNWEAGHHQVPYSAYKLIRLMTHQEFPNSAWAGWHMTAGVLYSPEGHGFKPKDSSWWSLLCRKAAMFQVMYAKHTEYVKSNFVNQSQPITAATEGAPLSASRGGRRPLDLSLGHFRTSSGFRSSVGNTCASKHRYSFKLPHKVINGGSV